MKPAGLGADPAGQFHAKGLEKATAISVVTLVQLTQSTRVTNVGLFDGILQTSVD